MIFQPTRFLFIHIPRTGGNSIKAALAPHMIGLAGATIGNSWWPSICRRHIRACELQAEIPQWDQIYKFAVIRNPWQTAASMYHHFRAMDLPAILARYENQGHLVRDSLLAFIEEIQTAKKQPFDDWLIRHYQYLPPGGGHWRHWCQSEDGQDLGFDIIKFENLAESWGRLSRKIGIPDAHLEATNAAPRKPIEWTPDAVAFVRQRFADDLHRFGYPLDPRHEN